MVSVAGDYMVHKGVFTTYPPQTAAQDAQIQQQKTYFIRVSFNNDYLAESPKIDNLDFCDPFLKVQLSPLAPI